MKHLYTGGSWEGRRSWLDKGAERTFKVGQVQHTGLVHPMVLATLKEGVKQVGQVGHNALALSLAQQHMVPLTQPITAGRLLPVWVAVEDVVIALQPDAQRCSGRGISTSLHMKTLELS